MAAVEILPVSLRCFDGEAVELNRLPFNAQSKNAPADYACFLRARRVRMLWWSREAAASRKRNGTLSWCESAGWAVYPSRVVVRDD